MGDIAEMVLEGLLCSVCGTFLDVEDEAGYPVACSECQDDEEY